MTWPTVHRRGSSDGGLSDAPPRTPCPNSQDLQPGSLPRQRLLCRHGSMKGLEVCSDSGSSGVPLFQSGPGANERGQIEKNIWKTGT